MCSDEFLIRINKAMAQAGFCSRRQADEWIAAGQVKVNGVSVSEPGLRVRPGDTISAHGKSLRVGAAEQSHTYLMLNKPVEVVSTLSDPQGRRTVKDLLPETYADKRLFPVGRLDYFSEGLLLMTDDGDLTQRLTHPRYHLSKYYEVLVREEPAEHQLELMRSGMRLVEGEKLAPVGAKLLGKEKRGSLLGLTLGQGVNRQIRRMCRDLGLTILRLRRLKQGSVELGGLASGKTRELTPEEVFSLKKDVGLS